MNPPDDYKTAGIFMTVAGALNFITAAIWILATMCLGLFWYLSLVVGIAELVMGIMVLQGQKQASAKFVAIAGIVAGLINCNVVAVVLEVLAFVWMGKPEVEAWLNGPSAPVGEI